MLSYWKAPNGPVERVYLQLANNRRIYGQRVVGDRVAWRGDEMAPADAERTAHEKIGGAPSWSELRQMACRSAPLKPQTTKPEEAPIQPPAARIAMSGTSPRRRPKTDPALLDTPYASRDTQKLDADGLGPLPRRTRLLIDPREPREIAGILSHIENLDVEVAALERGRYLVDGCLAVERISTHDLHRGIADDPRPLLKRVSDMSDVDHATFFIVEGGLRSHRRASLEKLIGAVSYVSVVHRVPIVETIDVWETVYMIVRAIGHACHPISDELPQPGHRRGGRKDHRVSPRYVLEGIPGVSSVRADTILERFGSLRAVADATVEELLDLQGLGPSVAQAVYDAFHMS